MEQASLAERAISKFSLSNIRRPTQGEIDAAGQPNAQRQQSKNKNNPFLSYGVAIENFFNLEVWLIKIFFVLTLLALPQMIVFASYNSNASF